MMFKRFLANDRERQAAQKRGGDCRTFSFDFAAGEERYGREPVDGWTPEMAYERRWALALLDRVLQRLQEENASKGRTELFNALKFVLAGEADSAAYSEIAGRLNMTEGAVKVAAHRLRKRYRDLLREEIAHTVERPDDVDDELTNLLAALRGEEA
jgi:RNA polymerase sigma-70 factor (ECF subfamily)